MTANQRINPTVKERNYTSPVSCSAPSKSNVAVRRNPNREFRSCGNLRIKVSDMKQQRHPVFL